MEWSGVNQSCLSFVSSLLSLSPSHQLSSNLCSFLSLSTPPMATAADADDDELPPPPPPPRAPSTSSDEEGNLKDPLLEHHSVNLRRHAPNNTSQVAIVGSNLCPIESLDYELIENDLFSQDWRSRGRAAILRYVFLKWTFCLFIGILAGAVGFFNNLAVENIAGFKFVAVSDLMLADKYWTAFWVFAGSNLALLMFATVITAFVSTAAGGSGIPEVKAYLNGVDAPDIFSLRTLVVKVRP